MTGGEGTDSLLWGAGVFLVAVGVGWWWKLRTQRRDREAQLRAAYEDLSRDPKRVREWAPPPPIAHRYVAGRIEPMPSEPPRRPFDAGIPRAPKSPGMDDDDLGDNDLTIVRPPAAAIAGDLLTGGAAPFTPGGGSFGGAGASGSWGDDDDSRRRGLFDIPAPAPAPLPDPVTTSADFGGLGDASSSTSSYDSGGSSFDSGGSSSGGGSDP